MQRKREPLGGGMRKDRIARGVFDADFERAYGANAKVVTVRDLPADGIIQPWIAGSEPE